MNMINELNVNYKVGRILIKLNKNNPINEEIIRNMINRYKNVYCIVVLDRSESINNSIHYQIKQLLIKSIVIGFGFTLE